MEAHRIVLPTVSAIRGPIIYGVVEVPVWLDSDPYRQRTYRYETPPETLNAFSEATDIVAVGGFCAPAAQFYDLFRQPTDAERAEMEERTRRYKRTLGYKLNRLRGWWRRHWWPARIRDLEARLGDDEW